MKNISLKGKFVLSALKNAKYGTLQMSLPDGSSQSFGSGLPSISMSVKKWSALDLLMSKGDLGLAENIVNQDIEIKEIASFIQWACKNEDDLRSTFYGRRLSTLLSRATHFFRRNSRKGAKRNILAHYDIGNEFYRHWLDSTMTYSAGIFADKNTSLEAAQLAKYDRIIDRLGIKSTDHVLEIGCGWGGFFSRAIDRTGCKVTAVLNSDQQAEYCKSLAEKKGLQGKVQILNMDYRDIRGQFDKVVSIEMIEAVGEEFWPIYFSKVSECLVPNGKAMIQAITIREDLFEYYRRNTDFIQQYIFPGGMLLTNTAMNNGGKAADLHLQDVHEFGVDYADTLRYWQTAFIAHRDQIVKLNLDDKFIRIWDLYLGYCEGAFRAGRINVGQFLFQKV